MKQIFLMAGLSLLLLQPLTAQTDSMQVHRKTGPERKLMEMKKIITLSPVQEQALLAAYAVYQRRGDSILYKVADPAQAATLKYQADKQWQTVLMQTLTEAQKVQYLTVTNTPEVMAQTQAKVQLLRESGNYSEQELAQKQKEIFNYLIAEKIVCLRDRYDIAKQADNLQRMKRAKPASLSESEAREELKANGKVNNGKINW